MSKIIKILIGIVLVIIIALVVVIKLVNVNQYKGDVISLVEQKTGREFKIDGNFKFALSLIPTVEVKGISFGNAAWGSAKDMLKVGRLEVQVALLPLISGTIQVNKLILDSPEILLETNRQGVGNWILTPAHAQPTQQAKAAKAPGKTNAKLPNFAVDKIRITNAKIAYRNGETGKRTNLIIHDITINGGGTGDPIAVTMNAVYNAIPIKLTGKLGAPELLVKNENYPAKVTANVGHATLSIDGRIAKPLEVKGMNLKLAFRTQSLHALSGITATRLPDLGPLDFSGTLTDSGKNYNLRSISVRLADSNLSGNASLSLAGNKPSVKADFSSKLLDLARLSGQGKKKQPAKKKGASAKVFPSTPLPLASLHSADVDIKLHAKRIHSSAADLDDAILVLHLHKGKLAIEPFDTRLAGGTIKSIITLDGSNPESAELRLHIDGKNLHPGLLPELKGKLTGAVTSVELNASGRGRSIAGIMANLNGKLLLQSGAGVYKSSKKGSKEGGIFSKTYSLVNPEAGSNQGTKIECMVVNMDVKNGVSSIDRKIALESDKIDVIGSGTVNFKKEQLDIGVVPQARAGIGLSAKQLAELVRLRGTFANPRVAPDTKAALKAGLSAGAAVATGGLSLLAQGLLNRSRAESDPCAVALGKTPAQKTTTQKKQTTSKPQDNSVKDLGNTIKNKLKGLFGN